jgi:N-acetylglucosamine-6-phosphate deacetylase
VIDAGTRIPERVLGLDDSLRRLQPGHDADLVVLDNDLAVHATVIGGRVVHRAAPPESPDALL